MVKQFLNMKLKTQLEDWVAGHNEGYPSYLEFCERNAIPENKRFTPAYWRIWVQRRRPKIHAAKEARHVRMRDMSEMDKQSRVALLEEGIARMRMMIQHDELSFTEKIRAEEQIRKHMESIAKERGEFAKDDIKKKLNESPMSRLRALSRERLNAGKADGIVEGEVLELPAGGAP